MCIVITKPKGVKAPAWSAITNSCDNNPHGFAVTWHREGMAQPEIKRTLNKEEFLKYMKEVVLVEEQDQGTSWVLHARIKSQGPVKLENCHCWRDEKTGLVFCHNGTLSIKAKGDMTDSETFFRYLYIPAMLGGSDGNAVVEAIIGTSKFAFMKPDGSIVTYGTYVTDASYPGVQFSNSSYKPVTYNKTYYSGGGYGGGTYYSRGTAITDDYDEYDEWGPYGAYTSTKTTTTSKSASKTACSILTVNHGWHFFKPGK